MDYLIVSAVAIFLAYVLYKFKLPTHLNNLNMIKSIIATVMVVLGLGYLVSGAVGYNNAGRSTHIQTIFGNEDAKMDTGWYFSWWGKTTVWPNYITVAHTNDTDSEGSSISPSYSVKLNDNWKGYVTQATRFRLPVEKESFISMHNKFRIKERLITTTLRPAVTASIDTVANQFSMEEYYAGGRRDDFKTEFSDTVTKGRAIVEKIEKVKLSADIDRDTSPSDSELASDTAKTGGNKTIKTIIAKKFDKSGNVIRIPHDYMKSDIIAESSILEKLEPVDEFEHQITQRKEAAARRSIAYERRLEEEEQRLLALASAEKDIAERQGEARVVQIQRTTEAETEKRLALIKSDKLRSQARIQKETSEINLEKAKIDAQSIQVIADAEAYEKRVILEADGALDKKRETFLAVQAEWASAYAKRQVPSTIFMSGGSSGGSNGTDSDTKAFIDLMTMNAAQQLQLDLSIRNQGQEQ